MLLAGLSFAVVATAVAGARRTATSFDRLRAMTLAYDHGVAIDAPGSNPGGGTGYDDATVARNDSSSTRAAAPEREGRKGQRLLAPRAVDRERGAPASAVVLHQRDV